MDKTRIPLVVIGAGKMGGALLNGWLQDGISPSDIMIIDPAIAEAGSSEFHEKGIRIEATPPENTVAQTLIIAIKPQMMGRVLPQISGLGAPQTLIVSVAAGTPTCEFKAAFSHNPDPAVVRVMPNTPSQVGKGMSVIFANEAVSAEKRDYVDKLMCAVGTTEWIDDESLMDAVTAVSGSGPAYVFHLVEAMASAGVAAGLPPQTAEKLARQTVIGGGALLDASQESAATLRQNVTSPGGTTAAALAVLTAEDKKNLTKLMTKAVKAATKRGRQLGGKDD